MSENNSRTKWKQVAKEHEAAGKKKSKQIEELESQIAQLNGKIEKVNEQLTSAKANHATKEQEWQENLNTRISEWDATKQAFEAEKQEFVAKLENARKDAKGKQDQINKMQLKRMAAAYSDQEEGYGNDVKEWKRYLFFGFIILAISTAVSLWLASGKPWYDRFEYYLLDLIAISFIWFAASQYSYYVKLRSDFANRKTLAQTYHNLLTSLEETSPEDPEHSVTKETKRSFIEKATTVLCAPDTQEKKEPVLTKKMLKDVVEIAKIFK